MKKIGPTMGILIVFCTLFTVGYKNFNKISDNKKSEIINTNQKIKASSNEVKVSNIVIVDKEELFNTIDTIVEEEQKKEEIIKNEKEEEIKNNVENLKEIVDPKVYDGLTMTELTQKLERNLNSTLSGYGYLFASYSLSLGLDPYLALAITLQETGCKWNCSTLVKECNNVGGMKGSPGCNGGSYKAFPTLEEGIKSYLDNLYYNYYSIGLTTPELINPKYAESTEWSRYVNNYLIQIRAS